MRLLSGCATAGLVILFTAGLLRAQQAPGRGQQAPAEQQPQPPVPPSAYTNYVSREDFFSVYVPCQMTSREIGWVSEYKSPLPARVYSCTRGPETYSMTVVNYTDIERIHKAQPRTEADQPNLYWRIDVNGSVAFAATKLRQRAAKVTFDSFELIDLIPGHQLHLTNTDGTRTFAGIYLHEYRLYILEATTPVTAPPPGLFQQSLSVLNAEGTRIRYPNTAPYKHPW
jgi:hypothetical protein